MCAEEIVNGDFLHAVLLRSDRFVLEFLCFRTLYLPELCEEMPTHKQFPALPAFVSCRFLLSCSFVLHWLGEIEFASILGSSKQMVSNDFKGISFPFLMSKDSVVTYCCSTVC